MALNRPATTFTRTVRVLGQLLLSIATLLVFAYFLTTSAPGKAYIGTLIAEDTEGQASIGTLVVDPAGNLMSVLDLRMETNSREPIFTLEQATVTRSSLMALANGNVDKFFARNAKLYVTMDEQGNLNLDTFFKKKEPKEPSPPSPFQLDDIDVEGVSLSLKTPIADFLSGPASVHGKVSGDDKGKSMGTIQAKIDRFNVVPKTLGLQRQLEALLQSPAPHSFGPFSLETQWNQDEVLVKKGSLELPAGLTLAFDADLKGDVNAQPYAPHSVSANVTLMWKEKTLLSAQLEMGLEANKGHLEIREITLPDIPLANDMVLSGVTLGSLSARGSIDAQGWNGSLVVDRFQFPGLSILETPIPQMNIEHVDFAATPERVHGRIKGVKVSLISTGDLTLHDLELESRINLLFAGDSQAMVDLLRSDASQADKLQTLLKHWNRGEFSLRISADKVSSALGELPAPLSLVLSAEGAPDRRYKFDLRLVPAVGGAITVHAKGVVPPEIGPQKLQLTFDNLDLGTLLKHVSAPAMLANNLGGTVSGTLAVTLGGGDPGMAEVTECSIVIDTPAATLELKAPQLPQMLDLNNAPNPASLGFVVLMGGEIKFGDGKLLLKKTPKQPTK